MFHVTWTTFKFKRDQLETVSAYIQEAVETSPSHRDIEIEINNIYSMFHATWTTFKFNRNQLGMVSVYVM